MNKLENQKIYFKSDKVNNEKILDLFKNDFELNGWKLKGSRLMMILYD